MHPEEDTVNFWKVASINQSEDDYWRAYEATRPNYAEDNFLNIIYDYHSFKASTSFEIAHDVGCGSGIGASELATRFAHVVASDNNASSLNAAHRFLVPTPNSKDSDKFTFVICMAEELAAHHEPQSADLVAAAECLPLMDGSAALSAFSTILKPGGTLAIWFYARPHFSEPEYISTCQPIFDRILDCIFSKLINGHGSKRTEGWKKAAEGCISWLDYLDFFEKPGEWEKVVRRKWNNKSTQNTFFTPAACDFELEPISKVTAEEEVIEVEDPSMWERRWDMRGVKDFIDYSFPNVKSLVDGNDEIQGLLKKLQYAMGGEREIRAFKWPIVLVLATKS
ncbi:hypothetical protein MFRU_011g02080 [Monilinia fructicola]|uniref:Methyltransferase type 11 domain-containing protein n=1 Tax=Monilinia fructicola TaxID=38448 RepID=A0A5M9JRP9_MONFR|nr:hypothetical protein EYC84_000124 [Monilinia fructicola]KAG4030753.1 hypothetical protein MFRU_011g02080 [Monilinia fructicola]